MTIAEKLEEKGMAKGREEGKTEVALNLLREGADVEFVAKVAGLPVDQVIVLQKSL